MTRIKIAIGNAQIEYEGEQDFIEGGLLELAREIFDLAALNEPIKALDQHSQTNHALSPVGELSTNTIAQQIGVKTGSDLALAAVARIVLVQKKPTADRQNILEEMKEAVTFYKESYSSNLTAYLETLVRSRRLNVVSRGTYGLASGERGRLEQALAMASA